MTSDPRIGERVEIFKGEDGQWYFRRVAANNEKVSSSEGYGHFGDAEAEARKIFPDTYVFVQADDGSWAYWEPNEE